MIFELNKKFFSNVVFVLAMGLLIYSPTRIWLLRQVAFSPSVENVKDRVSIKNYDWQLQGLNTENINFSEVKGKVVFVNFWATWCPPCKAELPMIQKLYNDYKDKVIFIFVTNENWGKVSDFFNKNNYNLPVYNSISTPPNQFLKTNSIPSSFLVDKNGSILIEKVGAADWNSDKTRNIINEILKN
ncbi:MAG: redoxin family protein [Lutibacter sp.]|uniref:TlpA family protein disulfide reductase n=1 Tax=Lutibacter sp. TaxID=1925666 RepID=UPI00299D9C6A|nr:redoxin family protein [Lutibacter sp.]MDX1828027.1 redoxin family protein [Lutibacter sp.]